MLLYLRGLHRADRSSERRYLSGEGSTKANGAGRTYSAFIISENDIGVREVKFTISDLHKLIGCQVMMTAIRYIQGIPFRVFANECQDYGHQTLTGKHPIRGTAVLFGYSDEGVRSVTDFEEYILTNSIEYVHLTLTGHVSYDAMTIPAEKGRTYMKCISILDTVGV